MLDWKLLTDVLGASLTTCYYLSSIALEHCTPIPFKNASSRFYEKNNFFSILFCTIYKKEHIFKYKIKGTAADCSFFPQPFIGNLTQSKYFFSVWPKFFNYMGGVGAVIMRCQKSKSFVYEAEWNISFLL